eukprot:CAMPEP_0178619502 /NCGR_PEP_ID=MMETSP0698-20121128/4800_1 /TAXON_ID=265572 /ORGANISM="Extubocellulus spinifer, Strain CCMP396" /LENGTH=343 /DNA_ID=CAMNT_0020258445 /DNA_START=1 /DNA_END=1033 /DNA_ORIENTATION=-
MRATSPILAFLLLACNAASVLYVASIGWASESSACTYYGSDASTRSGADSAFAAAPGAPKKARHIKQYAGRSVNDYTAHDMANDKNKTLPEGFPRRVQSTWTKLNGADGWSVQLWDDAEVDAFVARTHPDYASTFRNLPLAVMRADVWRLLILADRGGLYADADVECKVALRKWLPNDCEVVLGLDFLYDAYFSNFFLGGREGHPLLRFVAEYVMNRTMSGKELNVSNPDMVHETTGPAVLTEAVLSYLGIDVFVLGRHATDPTRRPVRLSALMREAPLHSVARLRHGICLFGKMFIGPIVRLANGQVVLGSVVTNHIGSDEAYQKAGWVDWRAKRDQLAAAT